MQTFSTKLNSLAALGNHSNTPQAAASKTQAPAAVPAVKILKWSEQTFGTLKVSSPDGMVKESVEKGIVTYAPFRPKRSGLSSIRLDFSGYAAKDGWLFRVTKNQLGDRPEAKKEPLNVSVRWKGETPSLVGTKDVNFVFLRPDGSFVQLEVSLVVRKPRGVTGFYLVVQEVFRGWIAATDAGPAFVPAASANAYPGVDYRRSAVGADLVIDAAVQREAVAKAGTAVAATWTGTQHEVPDGLKQYGLESGVVLWYNISLGGGQVVLQDGRICFAHMSSILGERGRSALDEGSFPLLLPLAQVDVQVKKEEARLQAEAVRAV